MRALHLFSISLSLCVYFWLRDLSVRLCVFMCVYVCEDYTASGPDLVHMLLGNPPLFFLLLSPSPAADYVSFSAQTSRAEAKNWMIFQRHINIKM